MVLILYYDYLCCVKLDGLYMKSFTKEAPKE